MQLTPVSPLAFVQNLSPIQILVVVFLILLLFGAKRLPELGRGMGKFVREFKKTTHEIEEDIRSSIDDDPTPKHKPQAAPKTEARRSSAES
jgi:sec-independent protein translocase protein TatA